MDGNDKPVTHKELNDMMIDLQGVLKATINEAIDKKLDNMVENHTLESLIKAINDNNDQANKNQAITKKAILKLAHKVDEISDK